MSVPETDILDNQEPYQAAYNTPPSMSNVYCATNEKDFLALPFLFQRESTTIKTHQEP